MSNASREGALSSAIETITSAVNAAIEATGDTYGDTWNSARMAALIDIREVIRSATSKL